MNKSWFAPLSIMIPAANAFCVVPAASERILSLISKLATLIVVVVPVTNKLPTDKLVSTVTSPVKVAPVKSAFNNSIERAVDISVLKSVDKTTSVERAVDVSVLISVDNTTSVERAVDVSVLKSVDITTSVERAVDVSVLKSVDITTSVERAVDVSVLKSLVKTNSLERDVDISADKVITAVNGIVSSGYCAYKFPQISTVFPLKDASPPTNSFPDSARISPEVAIISPLRLIISPPLTSTNPLK